MPVCIDSEMVIKCREDVLWSDRVVFQATRYHSATITAKFDVRGLYNELAAFSSTIEELELIPAEVAFVYLDRPG